MQKLLSYIGICDAPVHACSAKLPCLFFSLFHVIQSAELLVDTLIVVPALT
jgi:hypothetical protein